VWFGVPPEGQNVEVSPPWVNENEITIRGSFNNPFTHATALELVASGRVDVEAVVTDTVSLDGLAACSQESTTATGVGPRGLAT
jgi:threonine dehydrogenase-like Zn-dependent dehydrogenase